MPKLPEPMLVQRQPRLAGRSPRRERTDPLASVLRITTQLMRMRELGPLLELIAAETRTALAYSAVAVLLAEADVLVCRTSAGSAAAQPGTHRVLAGTSPAALAYQTGRPIFSATHTEQSACLPYRSAQQPCVSVPLSGDGHVLGVIEIRCDHPARWRGAEVEALLALAAHAASAIEAARRTSTELEQLYATLQARANQLALVDDISRAVTASLDQDAALHAIVTQVPRAVPCQRLSLSSYDAEQQALVIRALWNNGAPTTLGIGDAIPIEQTEAQLAIQSGRLHYARDLSTSSYAIVRRLVTAEDVRSAVYVPIMAPEGCMGTLILSRSQPNAFTPADLALLSSLAPHIATAFKNAALYAQAQQAYAELAAAHEHNLRSERLSAIGALASGVAHDFNNLLAIILGHMELLSRPSSPHFDQSRRMIIQAAQDGAQTVRRIQEFVRATPEQHSAGVDLRELADDVINLTQPRWQTDMLGRGIAITAQRRLSATPTVLGNAAELREVVTNLILNAVDAMPAGGTLTVSTGTTKGQTWIEVADTGPGIPAELRARIFEPFFTTKAHRGTGLGLAVSHSIALRHNGTLTLDSTPGQCTRFRLSLPIAAVQPTPAPQAQPAPIQLRPLRILLVEDDRSVREMLAQLLRLDDHHVDCAEDGPAALAHFTPGAYDLVCSDLGMPGMVGWELLAQIRACDPHVTTALISGWGAQLDADEVQARNVDFVVPKPIDIELLNQALALALRRAG